MKKKQLLIFSLIMLLFASCGKAEQADKLYYSIDNDNLQGLREVLADAPELDFNKLNQCEFTAFQENDRRDLSFALDGCADVNVGERTCLGGFPGICISGNA